jgi:pimeloyl-ACP methyl ester carboxylesterase
MKRQPMVKKTLWMTVASVFVTGTLYAQDITGDWQGALKTNADVRFIVRIKKELDGSLQARVIRADQTPADWGSGNLANAVSLEGSDFKFRLDAAKATYEGKLSADGNSMSGTWSRGDSSPLELRRATKETAWPDPVPHHSQVITVDEDVKLEVLDWGGSGRPLVLLTGLGNTAHVFDRFAPKLTDQYHVYGITRRGFGASSTPPSGYSAARLADDVLEVIDSLKLDRPVLVGHSVAGQELSSIGSRHPEKVAALVYLEAAYPYAFHDPTQACALPSTPPRANPPTVAAAIQAGTQKHTDIKPPVLAVYAAEGPRTEACATAFQQVVPSSRIVRVPGATHYVFGSNEAEVLKEIRAFISGLNKK